MKFTGQTLGFSNTIFFSVVEKKAEEYPFLRAEMPLYLKYDISYFPFSSELVPLVAKMNNYLDDLTCS